MKRGVLTWILMVCLLALTACGESNKPAATPTVTAEATATAASPAETETSPAAVEEQTASIQAVTETSAPEASVEADPAITEPAAKIDIDLTVLSSTIAQAQITDMTENNPQNYIGKRVKASGRYYNQIAKRLNLEHHYVLIGDELSCCAQLVEFVLKDGVYPESYPELDYPLTVEGVFDVRETDYGTFYAIMTDRLS